MRTMLYLCVFSQFPANDNHYNNAKSHAIMQLFYNKIEKQICMRDSFENPHSGHSYTRRTLYPFTPQFNHNKLHNLYIFNAMQMG